MSTIKIKRSGTSSQTPSSLEHGELALNYADGKLFYKDATNAIAELSTGGGSGGLDSAGVTALIDEPYVRDVLYNAKAQTNIGLDAGFASTSNFTIAIGKESGINSGNATNSIAIGFKAGQSIGGDTIMIGRETAEFAAVSNAVGIGTEAMQSGSGGSGAVAIGYRASQNGSGAEAIAIGKNTRAGGDKTIVIGAETSTLEANAIAIGFNSESHLNGQYSIAIATSDSGSVTYSTDSDWQFGASVTAPAFIGDGSQLTGISGGGGGLDSAGVQSLIDAEVQDPTTLTLGASSNAGIGIGSSVVTNGLSGGSVSIGTEANSYIQSVAIGYRADASATGSVSVGPNSQASGNFNTAIGRQATTSGSNSLALGYSSSAGNYGIALGDAASGQRSIAIGALASAPNDAAIHINANYNSGVGPTANGGLVIETSAARLEYSADSDWVFSAPVTSSEFKFTDGTSMTTAPTGGGSGGLDSAAVEAMIDSDLAGAESFPSTMKIGATASRIAIGSGATADRVNSMSIGTNAGRYIDGGTGHIVIGDNAGGASGGGQAHNIIAIGTNASTDISSVQYDTIALGYNAGRTNMGHYAIAIGYGSSISNAGTETVAIGKDANATGSYGIAIGTGAVASSNFAIDIRTSAAGSLTYNGVSDWTFGAGVTMTDLTASGATVIFNNLPTSDPINVGQLWSDGGTLKVSAG